MVVREPARSAAMELVSQANGTGVSLPQLEVMEVFVKRCDVFAVLPKEESLIRLSASCV